MLPMKNIFLALALGAASTFSVAAPVDEAKALMAKGNAAQASDLLEKTLDQHLSDVEHNYLLGIALLDSGKPGATTILRSQRRIYSSRLRSSHE